MPSQRVQALFEGKTPDRLPWLPELNDGFCRKTLGIVAGTADAGLPYRVMTERVCRKIDADHLHRVTSVKSEHRKVEVERDKAGGAMVYHTPKGDLRHVSQPDENSGTSFTTVHLVNGPQDFAAYRALVEDEQYIPDYAAAQQVMAQVGWPTIDVPATPLMHLLMWVMDVQPTLMAMMDLTDQMVELMAAMHERNKEYYRLAAAGPGLVYRPMEDTSAMLTGPRMYADYCLGHLNDYADIVHAAGKLFIPHMCGHLDPMLDVLADARLDGIEAITPPPLGNADLARMRAKLGDIWLWGGVDPSRYAAGREEIVAHVSHTLDVMRGDRKFILNHEEIPKAAKMENVLAVAELVAGTAGTFYR